MSTHGPYNTSKRNMKYYEDLGYVEKIKSAEGGEITCRESCNVNQYTSYDTITNEYTCANNCKDINLVFFRHQNF